MESAETRALPIAEEISEQPTTSDLALSELGFEDAKYQKNSFGLLHVIGSNQQVR